ncbi:MAG: hypothetical protein MK137_09170 [Rickettsiales bacterium]|nr:hypothetical protein [Rickettsiales bacterium]
MNRILDNNSIQWNAFPFVLRAAYSLVVINLCWVLLLGVISWAMSWDIGSIPIFIQYVIFVICSGSIVMSVKYMN